jgi:hypothetical protein
MWPRFGLKNSLKVAANQAEINSQMDTLTVQRGEIASDCCIATSIVIDTYL